jgi:uncharacterized protein YggE
MKTALLAAAALGAATVPGLATAQTGSPALTGTRLDIVATGEVTRVPDVAVITAGVVTRSPTASGAIEENARRMERVRAALKRAGIGDRDIQTNSISLNPDYRYAENQPPQLTGYQASNMVSVNFRDIRNTGRILDALVAQGANQLNGPSLTIDKPAEALDEARTRAIADGRGRAELYARALGMRVVRLLAVSEAGGIGAPPSMPMAMAQGERDGSSKIDPGEQKLQVSVTMSFELR